MKNICFILYFLISSFVAYSQNDGISEIRRLYKETQNDKATYGRLSQNDFENSSEGGELISYELSGEVRLIEAVYYGSIGKAEIEYYFNDNQVYFIFLKKIRYNAPPMDTNFDQNKTIVGEYRFYFWDNEMIRWVEPNSKQVNSETTEFKIESTKWFAEAAEIFEKVK